MEKDELTKRISIKDIYRYGDYIFVYLINEQKLLVKDEKIYDISEYDSFHKVITMNNIDYAIVIKDNTLHLINIETKKIIFKDFKAYDINKEDEKCLKVIMKIDSGDDAIYNIETEEYLSIPTNYEFEHSLENNLYVFREKNNSFKKEFKDRKRVVINANGKLLLKDITGWINYSGNCLVIDNNDNIRIINLNDEGNIIEKIVESNDKLLINPIYYSEKIVLVKNGLIEIYDLDLELINSILVNDLNNVVDYELTNNTLKFCISYKSINKHLFVNLKNGKSACIQLVKTNDGYNLIASTNKDGIVAKCIFDICIREVLQMKNTNIKANINRYLIKEKSILNGEIYSKIVDKNYIIKNNIPIGEETNVCRLKQIEILNEEYANIGIGSYLIKCAETFALEKGCYIIYGFFRSV